MAGRHEQQRVAVRIALGDVRGAQRAARAGLAVDQHRLAEPLAEHRGEQAREEIHRAAAAEAVHDANRPLVARHPGTGRELR